MGVDFTSRLDYLGLYGLGLFQKVRDPSLMDPLKRLVIKKLVSTLESKIQDRFGNKVTHQTGQAILKSFNLPPVFG